MLSRSAGSGAFEPRVIRPPGGSRGSCVDATSPSSATRSQGGSTSNTPAGLLSDQRTASLTSFQSSSHKTVSSLPSVPFQRPAYLEYSSLKHLLQTESPPLLPPGRYGHNVNTLDSDQNSRYSSLPFPRRRRTPLTESDDEGPFTLHSELLPFAPAYSPSTATANPVLRLPTRWSDQDRHLSLSVSPDGRELTFVGTFGRHLSVIVNDCTQVCHASETKMRQRLAQTTPSHLHAESTIMKWKL